ncbi:MAG: aminotransferase class V-fold PLP-dependent enzyme [Lachnospiraceae bacterium]|nr:aminotransferase class V-fold PLP-dependent enzyme [Lachnospiraceae bacterium]
MEQIIYLDNAATTFPKPEVVYTAMDEVNRNGAINASRGAYRMARNANKIISDTKNALRKLVSADSSVPVVFSPSITIALNQVINGLDIPENCYIYYSPYEHNAVARTLNQLAKLRRIYLRELPIDDESGEIEIEKLAYIFSKEIPTAIFCTHISNVTGYILPIEDIFAAGKKYNSINVLDAAQSLGLIECNVQKNKNIDIIAFTGHKNLYGPFGIGGFINVTKVPLKEFIVGGTGSDSLNLDMPIGNETKYESASSNIIAIVGLKAALDVLDVSAIYEHEKVLTDYLTQKLKMISNVKLLTPMNKERHIGIVSFVVEGYKSDDIGMILDEDFGIAVRTGYHCAPYIHSHLKDEKYLGTVRVGLSQFNSINDINQLLKALEELE